jgi:hypothetical protein
LQNRQKSVLSQTELLELDKSGIHLAEYLTVLPPKELLQAKLQQAIASARRRLPFHWRTHGSTELHQPPKTPQKLLKRKLQYER